MTSPKRWLLLGLSASALIVCVLAILPRRNHPVELPEGTVLRLAGVTYGTNAFVYGNMAERVVGKWLPARGLSVFGFTLGPPQKLRAVSMTLPQEVPPITVWFSLTGKDPSKVQFEWGWVHKNRVFAMSKSGRQLEHSPARVYSFSSKEVIFAAPLTAFPRDQKEIIVRVLRRDRKGEWSRAGDFSLPNPLRVIPQKWREQLVPATNQIVPLEVVLEKVHVRMVEVMNVPVPLSPELELQVTKDGNPAEEWEIAECVIRDSDGNFRVGSRTSQR